MSLYRLKDYLGLCQTREITAYVKERGQTQTQPDSFAERTQLSSPSNYQKLRIKVNVEQI